jgi:hypothetical protein
MRRPLSALVVPAFVVVAAVVTAAWLAPAAAAAEPSLRVLSPPDPQAATPVTIVVGDLQVFSIREQEEVFQLGGRLVLRWVDPRQAFDPDAAGTYRLEYQGQAAEDKLDGDVWWPDVEFVDAVGSRDRMAVNLTLDADGEVWYRERFLVDIKQDFYLGDFPYDQHRISFAVEPFTYSSRAVRFVAEDTGPVTASWEPTEWVVDDPLLEVSEGVRHLCRGAGGEEEGPFDGGCAARACTGGRACEEVHGFSRMTVSMGISRVSSHYNGNIILPMVLIVLIAGAVFWMDIGLIHLGDRLALSFTSLLTVVAFDFVTSSSLPKLWYSTVLDRIVTASYVFLAINIALSVLIDQLDGGGEGGPRRGRGLNRLLRWIFPLAYLACIAVLILGAG